MNDYVTVLLTIITVINSALALLILTNSANKSSGRVYSGITVMTLSWIWSIVFYRLSSPEHVLLWTKILYISATFIASNFLFFTYLFPIAEKFPWWKKTLIFIPNLAVIGLVYFTDLIIKNAAVRPGLENSIEFGKLYILYVIYILSYFIYSFVRLFIKYYRLEDKLQRRQAMYILVGYLISANIAFGSNLILPWLGYFNFNWLGQVSTVFIVTFATYAIVKHQLFNIKAVTAELFIGFLWIFLIIRIILGQNTQEKLLSGGLLAISIVIGVFLIRSINSEVRARQEIEKLAVDLADANDRLKELDKQKTEFVSLASHQLRGPLTAIKGYGSMLLEGDFGELQTEVKEAVEKMYKSTQDLVVVVGDYLDVSRIEQGRMQYDFSTFDLRELVQTVATELRPTVENAHLKLDFDCTPNTPDAKFFINADKGKIKQVLGNIIDNAAKYTPQGSIHIWLSKKNGQGLVGQPQNEATQNTSNTAKVLVAISDTGVGIHPDVMPKLFAKFTRAPDASKTNILGTGLGLYVARKMIEAHNGRIWAESAGTGKGSTFFIELDSVNTENTALSATAIPAHAT